MTQSLDDLFKTPKADEVTRARHKKLALEAFEQSAADKLTTTQPDQANTKHYPRSLISAVAASLMLVVGFVAFAPQLTSIQQAPLETQPKERAPAATQPRQEPESAAFADAEVTENVAEIEARQDLAKEADRSRETRLEEVKVSQDNRANRVMAQQNPAPIAADDATAPSPARAETAARSHEQKRKKSELARSSFAEAEALIAAQPEATNDTVSSYHQARHRLAAGKMPEAKTIVVAEFIDALHYSALRRIEQVTATLLVSPWQADRALLAIALPVGNSGPYRITINNPQVLSQRQLSPKSKSWSDSSVTEVQANQGDIIFIEVLWNEPFSPSKLPVNPETLFTLDQLPPSVTEVQGKTLPTAGQLGPEPIDLATATGAITDEFHQAALAAGFALLLSGEIDSQRWSYWDAQKAFTETINGAPSSDLQQLLDAIQAAENLSQQRQ